MEIVDVVIAKCWFSGRTSRSVNNLSQWPDLGLLAGFVGLQADFLGGLGGRSPLGIKLSFILCLRQASI